MLPKTYSPLFERLYLCTAVFVDEFGDEEDVMGTREDGEGEDGGVDGGEIVAGAIGDAGGEDDSGDGEDLDVCVDLAEH